MKATITIITTILLLTTTPTKPTPLNPLDPKPTPWPKQFHAMLIMNNTKTTELQLVDLYYDWINGRNLNLIHHQLGKTLYDVEWNNGTSFYFTRNTRVYGEDGPHGGEECRVVEFDVGILTPDWLHGASYLGQSYVDGFLCNVWDKVEFLTYYEDVVTKLPVSWVFYTGRAAHVMSFEVGAVLEDSEWQAPVYCFNKQEQRGRKSVSAVDHLGSGLSLLRPDAQAIL